MVEETDGNGLNQPSPRTVFRCSPQSLVLWGREEEWEGAGIADSLPSCYYDVRGHLRMDESILVTLFRS